MKKIIACEPCWACENLDNLAPITEEGSAVLFDDNTTKIFWNNEKMPRFEKATDEEAQHFWEKRGYIFPGNIVEIFKGRKFVGEFKTVSSFFRFEVPGTFGHQYTDYVVFDDGTRVNIKNIRPIVKLFDNVDLFLSCEKIKFLEIGGRI